jgi:hypothetical protein
MFFAKVDMTKLLPAGTSSWGSSLGVPRLIRRRDLTALLAAENRLLRRRDWI